MPLQWADGFDPYASISTSLWTKFTASGVVAINTTNQRNGRACLQLGNVGISEGGARRLIAGSPLDVVSMVAFATNNAGVAASTSQTNTGYKLVTTAGTDFRIKVSSSNRLGIHRGNTLLAETDAILTNNNYLPCYVRATISGVAPNQFVNLEFRCNGIEYFNGVAAGPGTYTSFASIEACSYGGASGYNYFYDDAALFVNPTTQELTMLAVLYDAQVNYAFPDANGTTQDWSNSGGGDAYQDIDEEPLSTADYIQGDAANDVSDFDTTDLSAGVLNVFGVFTLYAADKQTAGAGSVQASLVSDGTPGPGADNALLESTPIYYEDMFNNDPNTGNPWLSGGSGPLATLDVSFERTA